MKFRIAAIALLTVSAFSFGALETEGEVGDRDRSFIGVHAGVNVTNARLNAGDSNGYAGWMAGLGIEAPIVSDVLYLAPELNFLRVGAENNAFGGLATTRLDYVELPILFKAALPVGNVAPYLIAGPRVTYLLGSNTEAAGVNVNTEFNDLGLGAYLGAGVGLEVLGLQGSLSARYLLDFTDVDDGSGEWRSEGIQFLVGVLL